MNTASVRGKEYDSDGTIAEMMIPRDLPSHSYIRLGAGGLGVWNGVLLRLEWQSLQEISQLSWRDEEQERQRGGQGRHRGGGEQHGGGGRGRGGGEPQGQLPALAGAGGEGLTVTLKQKIDYHIYFYSVTIFKCAIWSNLNQFSSSF